MSLSRRIKISSLSGLVLGSILSTGSFLFVWILLGKSFFQALFSAVLMAALAAVIISFVLEKTVRQPIQKFVDQIKKRAESKKQIDEALPRGLEEFSDIHEAYVKSLSGLQKQMEALRNIEKMNQAKYEFITTVSHQLRTPTAGVRWALDLLATKEKDALSKEGLAVLDEAREALKRMIETIEEIFRVAQAEGEQMEKETEAVDIEDLMSELVRTNTLVAKNKNIDLRIAETQEQIPLVQAHRNQLFLALHNIISNAVNYSEQNDSIVVTITAEHENVTVEVADTGIGIPKKEQAKLFERFFRGDLARKVRPDGTGLGLFLSHRIITAYGGDIGIESKEGEGTTVTITLPVSPRGELEGFVKF